MSELDVQIAGLAAAARNAARILRGSPGRMRNDALLRMADRLHTRRDAIEAANAQDLDAAVARSLPATKIDRLRLTDRVIGDLVEGLSQVAAMPDPIGAIEDLRPLANGLKVGRMRIPLGVIGMIFESRPNVTVEASSLTLKSGNAILLRGGSEAFFSLNNPGIVSIPLGFAVTIGVSLLTASRPKASSEEAMAG